MSAFYSHPSSKLHKNEHSHPECPQRLDSIELAIKESGLNLTYPKFSKATKDDLKLGHDQQYIDKIFSLDPKDKTLKLDEDTYFNSSSLESALWTLGASLDACKKVLEGETENAFISMRPPGHHAKVDRSMGFCLFSNAALCAKYLIGLDEIKKVLIIDFDVHHGNGTEDLIKNDENIYFISTFQHPFYPLEDFSTDSPHILNVPLEAGTSSKTYKEVFTKNIIPWMEKIDADFVIISAGFDAHKDDPLGGLLLETEDFEWITSKIRAYANKKCGGKIVSLLEGGYNLDVLGDSVVAHLRALSH